MSYSFQHVGISANLNLAPNRDSFKHDFGFLISSFYSSQVPVVWKSPRWWISNRDPDSPQFGKHALKLFYSAGIFIYSNSFITYYYTTGGSCSATYKTICFTVLSGRDVQLLQWNIIPLIFHVRGANNFLQLWKLFDRNNQRVQNKPGPKLNIQ